MPDYKGLRGDPSDNIPGIPGIGYTTAAKILQKFDGVEHVISNMAEVATMKFRGAARIHALLKAHGHILPLNKQLTTVVTDMEFPPDIDLTWRGINQEVFGSVADKLALSPSLQQRWLNIDFDTTS